MRFSATSWLPTVLLCLVPAIAAADSADYAAHRAELARRIGPDAMLVLV